MPLLSESIIENVEASYIETYLKKKGKIRSEEEKGQDLKHWVDNLLLKQMISLDEFESFLFDELFWGKRKTIHIYKLDQIKNYKYPIDWETPLNEIYNLNSIDFCNILNNIPNEESPRKIAAIRSEENSRGELLRIRLLFVVCIQINKERGYVDSTAYLPVEIDFLRKIMVIKAWTRQQVAFEEHKADSLIQHIQNLMRIEFKVATQSFGIAHKKVLFQMSKNLIYEAYSNVPTYSEIEKIKEVIKDFIEDVYMELPLKNILVNNQGKHYLPEEVLNFEGELRNAIECLAISDYFFERNFDEIWKMGLEAVVSRVKFNDKEKVLTSLSGEQTETPIFCTKTFMSLKNRMEETEKIETLWITMEREKGNLNLKFDATKQDYLEILIKYGIRFNESDMISALSIYEKYESKLANKIKEQNKIAIGQ